MTFLNPRSGIALVTVTMLLFTASDDARADGTEILGPPGIAIEPGSGIAVGGAGLQVDQPQTFDLFVPDGAEIQQVLLYWSGGVATVNGNPADDTIVLEGVEVTGEGIGGPAFFFTSGSGGDFIYSSFRADITSLGLVAPGANSLSVEGLEFRINDLGENSGAAVVVIFEEAPAAGDIQVVDGLDLAFEGFLPSERGFTVPQTFSFVPEAEDRIAELSLIVGSVFGGSNLTRIEVDGVVSEFPNLLTDSAGPVYDVVTVAVEVPAGASSITVELISGDGVQPAGTLSWIAAALSVPGLVPTGEPDIDIEKTPELQEVREGDQATFTITVTNTGSEDLLQVKVFDLLAPDCNARIGELPVGDQVAYDCGVEASESFVNKAIARGRTEQGTVVKDRASAEVLVIDDDDGDDDDDDGDDDDDSDGGDDDDD